MAEINQLLAGLCVPDNDTRRAAEAAYEAAKTSSPEQLAAALVGAIGTDPAVLQPHLKGLAAVLLRRLISGSTSQWANISGAAQAQIRASLLQSVQDEQDDTIRSKVCDALAELASELLDDDPQQGWPGLLQALMALVNHPGPSQREMALEVFARIAESVIPQLDPAVIVQVLEARLADTVPVRLAALKALCAFLGSLAEGQMSVFQVLLPSILGSVSDPHAVSNEAEPQTKEMLEILVELVEYSPRFFRPAINDFCSLMVALASGNVPESLRQLSVEWIVTLAEAKPTLARKVTVVAGGSQVGFPMASMQVCVGMMAEVEDDPDWARSDEEVEDPDETRNCDVGAQALDRLAIALGHKTALPVAFQLINEQLALEAQAWIHPHTALHAMCQVVEAGKDTDLAGPMQAQVVQCASHLLGHAHPRVRYMALQALGQLLLDHGPDVHRSHHAQIVPALVASIDASTNPSPRVRSHALAATINFVDYCEPSELAPYLDQLLVAALGAMQVGPRIVQEQAVAMVSSASMVMEEQLGLEQYNLLMPILQQALAQCPAEFKLLKGRLLECISLLGLAVPKEKFAQDVMPIMAAMAQASDLNGGLDADDPQKTFILKAWVRIGKALGQDFVPYLSVVMPALLHAIETSVESELRPEQLEEDGGADVDSDTECIIQNAAGKLVQVRTSALEDQATAAHMILLLAESLGPHFFPYVERCAGALAPLAVTSVHDDVRTYAMAAMPELVSCAAQALAPQPPEARWTALGEMLHFFVSKLIEALEKEGEMEALMTAMQSLKACVENACRVDWSSQPAAPGGLKASRPPLVPSTCQVLLSEASMTTASTRLLQCLAESIQRRAVARAEAATDEDYDEEQREADALKGGEEEELQFNMSEVLGALLKTHGQAFLPQLSREWMPRLSEMSNEACLVTDRKLASYIFCDAIEYCGEAIAPLLDTLMPLLLSGVDSDEPTLRQPCAYGVGVAACKATQALGATGWVDHCLERLCAAASKSGARDGEQESATDNVVSAIGALCVELAAHPSVQRDRDPLWQLYLSYLPLKRDLEEAAKATLQLCRLTRAGDEGLLGVGRGRLPRVWELVLSAIGEKGTTDVVHREITETIGFLTTSLPAGEIEALWAATSPEVAQKARALVQSR